MLIIPSLQIKVGVKGYNDMSKVKGYSWGYGMGIVGTKWSSWILKNLYSIVTWKKWSS